MDRDVKTIDTKREIDNSYERLERGQTSLSAVIKQNNNFL